MTCFNDITAFRKRELEYIAYTLRDFMKSEVEYVSQNKAYKRYGRRNVEKWVDRGMIKRFYRGRVIQYKMEELVKAAAQRQDLPFLTI